ncbi:MAG: hypothetical protein U5L45_20970 [Saprospiraceae bacterium]|nr:hypothetical protein [Saprospiraceae bacterium]
MVFQRYADISFLFFYGNQQNMFGLESVLEKLKVLGTNFYLVNSPVPIDVEEDEIDYFLDKSYEIFTKYYYEEESIPDIKDTTAPHYPLIVPYNELASFLNSSTKIKGLLETRGSENPYLKIAEIILAEGFSENGVSNTDINVNKALVEVYESNHKRFGSK